MVPSHCDGLFGEQVRDEIIIYYKVQIKMEHILPEPHSPRSAEDCSQTNADKQNSKRLTAAWPGEQVKMNKSLPDWNWKRHCWNCSQWQH